MVIFTDVKKPLIAERMVIFTDVKKPWCMHLRGLTNDKVHSFVTFPATPQESLAFHYNQLTVKKSTPYFNTAFKKDASILSFFDLQRFLEKSLRKEGNLPNKHELIK
jgi:hypothetical protein